MKVAYLLLVHQHPALVERLVRRLASPNAQCFVHVDAKSDGASFRDLARCGAAFTAERIPVAWGEFSQVDAILLLIRTALQAAERYEYFVLLSGSDYPLRSAEYIEQFLAEHRGMEFMSMVKVPGPGKPLSRLTTLRFPQDRSLLKFTFRVAAKVGLATRDHRKYLGELEPYSGSTWWALTREACGYLLEFDRANPHVATFFRYSFAPDEAFFHTILGNSPYSSRLRRNLLFEDWSACGAHPALINADHLRHFANLHVVTDPGSSPDAELLFARKFSPRNAELLDEMDDVIRRKELAESQLL